MAKQLYDYWFVQFDFPNENGKPYKSSGGKMVWDEKLKREIPEGWEVKPLQDIAKISKGTLITEKTANNNGDIKVISAGINFSYKHDEANRDKNTITISASGANAGYINFWREPIFACDCTTVRGETDIMTIILSHFLKLRQEYIFNQAKGSAQPHIYPSDIINLKMAVPTNDVIVNFEKKILFGNDIIANNQQENQKLTKLRDELLPLLMNGQVSVNYDLSLD